MKSLEQKIGAAVLKMIRARREPDVVGADAQGSSAIAIAPAKLREARFSDFPAVVALKQRGAMHADSVENWERLWRLNPALEFYATEPEAKERPIGWVLEANGEIVGYIGNISLLYRFGGRTLTAVTAHGLVVDPPYRGVGITLVAAYFRQKNVDLFVSTSAIEAVGKIALAFKSSPLPQRDYDTALFWVLRPHGFARAMMQKLKVASAPARLGSIAAALTIGADKIFRRRRPHRTATCFTVSEIGVDEIGSDFQNLWTGKQKERCRLLADRTPAALRWHFKIPGDRGSARVLCCHLGDELVGYAVIRNDTNEATGLRTSIIADTLAKNDDPEIVRALWAAAYDHAEHMGSHVLEVLGFPPNLRSVTTGWKPYRRKYPACPFFYKTSDPALQNTLSNAEAWYASPYDGDATLIRPSYSVPRSSAGLMRMGELNAGDSKISEVLIPSNEPQHIEVS
jgi:ribosomal protein S18 acetylase RimI-like enzyme